MRAENHRSLLDRLRADESGSMVMALLVIIMASGLMLTVTAYVLQGHRGVRFDRDHTRVVQGADAGVHQVLYRLNLPSTDSQRITTTTSSGGWQTDLGDYDYQWTVTPDGVAGRWRVNASGRLNGVERHVVAIISQPRPFQYAAFADDHLTFVGGNNANSYSSVAWGTLQGNIGTNGNITLNGNVTADDAAVFDNPTSDSARCTSNGNAVCSGADHFPEEMDIASDAAMGFITDAIDPANGLCTASPPVYRSSVNGALAPGTYCFSTMIFDSNVTLTSTTANPVIVYLTNPTANPTITSANRLRINCPSCTGTGGPRPDAGALQIYTSSYGSVRIGNNSHFAGVIYAPRASCRGNPSNAQTQFYGSMVCGIITNQGGWGFHYDTSLADLGAGGYDILRWSED